MDTYTSINGTLDQKRPNKTVSLLGYSGVLQALTAVTSLYVDGVRLRLPAGPSAALRRPSYERY